MKRIVKFLSIFILAIIMLNLVGCNDGEEETAKEVKQETSNKSSNSHYPVTITTYNWNKEPVEITFEKAPEKVVAIYQSSIETLL
ncbi:MAG: ABC transporter substrate-binding protein, partial [Senegalia sp. (in: firmicutes)]